ncbi:MAG: hypothetical protein AB7D07_01810 [Desulfovibrionaceae bacterium]|jgi:hypothetical protein
MSKIRIALTAALALLILLPAQAFCASGTIHVMSARYGNLPKDDAGAALDKNLEVNTQATFCDAKKAVKKLCEGKKMCVVKVGNELCGDPYKGKGKYLFVEYTCGDMVERVKADEGDAAAFGCKGATPVIPTKKK